MNHASHWKALPLGALAVINVERCELSASEWPHSVDRAAPLIEKRTWLGVGRHDVSCWYHACGGRACGDDLTLCSPCSLTFLISQIELCGTPQAPTPTRSDSSTNCTQA